MNQVSKPVSNQAPQPVVPAKPPVVSSKPTNTLSKRAQRKNNRVMIKKIKKWNKPHKSKTVGKYNLQPTELIKLHKVTKYVTNGYNYEYILKGVDLTIYRGEFVVILGPSGSGKTTLLTILSGLERPSGGDCFMFAKNTITLNSAKLTKLRAKHVGYIFQQYGLLEDLTVEDNVKLGAGLNKKQKLYEVDKLLEMVGLMPFKKKKAKDLSGGQQQRVAICRAIVKNPDILFGDEPTGAVHVDATKQIMQIFKKINEQNKMTIVLVTHNKSISYLADRIITIQDGLIASNEINKAKKTVEEIDWNL